MSNFRHDVGGFVVHYYRGHLNSGWVPNSNTPPPPPVNCIVFIVVNRCLSSNSVYRGTSVLFNNCVW